MQKNIVVVIPNWNGAAELPTSIESVLAQSHKQLTLIVVDNGSVDESPAIIEQYKQRDARVRSIYRDKNYGFTGGVNPGIEVAIQENADYVALFNNDARADKNWLKHLAAYLDSDPQCGIAACTLLHADGKTIDSTADQYSIWGIPFPRGRDEPATSRYDSNTVIFGASGGASMYRVAMLREIGLFDQDFFAYYEDIDISFRAQLAGWHVRFVPAAVVYHDQGVTSARLGKRKAGDRAANPFTTRQYMRNLPFILVKDMPAGLLRRVLPRFIFGYSLFFLKALTDKRGIAAIQGNWQFWLALPRKLQERKRIQASRRVSDAYLWELFIHDLPPNAYKLQKLRALWWRLRGRKHR
jgi:GT2 family glycosyltransferase